MCVQPKIALDIRSQKMYYKRDGDNGRASLI